VENVAWDWVGDPLGDAEVTARAHGPAQLGETQAADRAFPHGGDGAVPALAERATGREGGLSSPVAYGNAAHAAYSSSAFDASPFYGSGQAADVQRPSQSGNVSPQPAELSADPSGGPEGPLAPQPPANRNRPSLQRNYGQLPLSFEPNVGQTDSRVQFLSKGHGYDLFLTPTEAVLTLQKPLDSSGSRAVLHMGLVGVNANAVVTGQGQLPGISNYFLGNDPTKWYTRIPTYRQVVYHNIYPGIDLVYYGNDQRQLEYDFVVSPSANPAAIQLAFQGASTPTLDGGGHLHIATPAGEVLQHAPLIYQIANGGRRRVQGAHTLGSNNQIGFQLGQYDPSSPLYIDPVLSYSTYLGGSGSDSGNAIAVDAAGASYVTGQTNSPNFPLHNPIEGSGTVFVTKLDPTGTMLLYSTRLGGSAPRSRPAGIVVDSAGRATITGLTLDPSFPVRNPFQGTLRGGQNAFVTQLSSDGASLVYSTYLGGSGNDEATAIGLDLAGNVYLTGITQSTDFPTATPFQPSTGTGPTFKSTDGGTTWHVANVGLNTYHIGTLVIDPTNPSNLYAGGNGIRPGLFKSTDGGATWMASSLQGSIGPIAVDPLSPSVIYAAGDPSTSGLRYLYKSIDAGRSWYRTNYDTYVGGPVQSLLINPATHDVFVGTTSGLYYSVYKSTDGGTSWSVFNTFNGIADTVNALLIDPTASTTIYAGTASHGVYRSSTVNANWTQANSGLTSLAVSALPVDQSTPTNIFAGTSSGVFISNDGATSWSSTNLNASVRQVGVQSSQSGSTVYASGAAGVFRLGSTGWAVLQSAPGTEALAVEPNSVYISRQTGFNAFVTKLNSSGSTLAYSTYLGGQTGDNGRAVAVDAGGNAYVVGSTQSPNFPIANALQPAKRGSTNAFVTKLNASGSGLSYSTYLGGSSNDFGNAVAVDEFGDAYVAGGATSSDFPTANALQPRLRGSGNAFVARLTSGGNAFVYSTYLGGSGSDGASGIASDAGGNAYVTGGTRSSDFPVANAIQPRLRGSSNAYVAKLEARGSELAYSTYLGGSGNDGASAIAVDSAGSAYITGQTTSADFPGVGTGFQSTYGGQTDAFIAKVSPPIMQRLNDADSSWLDESAEGLAPNTGTVRLSQSLDFRQSRDSSQDGFSGLGAAAALVYNSDSVSVRPVGEVAPSFDIALGAPSNPINLGFFWNSSVNPLATYTFDPSAHNLSDRYLLADQIPVPSSNPPVPRVDATGLYPWSFRLQAHFGQPSPPVDISWTYADLAQAIVSDNTNSSSLDNSAFGPGWSLAGLNRIVSVPGGALLVYGSGLAAHYFKRNLDGSYTSPSNDFGSLTLAQSSNLGTYTYTSSNCLAHTTVG
jgi:hypothetical protein